MKIRIFYRLENGVYRVSVCTEDWSENDVQLMEKYGEPEIDIGGDFHLEPNDSEPLDLFLPESHRRVKTESPITMSFDSRDMSHAKDFANAWADRISEAISSAFSSLHSHSDGFTRETVRTLSAD